MSNPGRGTRHPPNISTSPPSTATSAPAVACSFPTPASPLRSTASSSASTAVPMSTSSPIPPRSFSDPLSHLPTSSSLGLQPSPDVQVKYGVDGPRRASWTTTSRSSPVKGNTKGSYADPLRTPTGATGGVGDKIQYGPGFYIPPPGYQAWSMGAKYDMRAYGAGHSADRNERRSFGVGAEAWEGRAQVNALAVSDTCGNVPPDQKRPKRTMSAQMVRNRQASASSKGALTIWAIFGILLAGSQASLLRLYDNQNSTLCKAISFGGLFLELYGVLVAVISILVKISGQPSVQVRTQAASSCRKDVGRKRSFASTLLESTTSIAGFVICLGAVSQLAALVVYASQSLDKAIAYSMTIAIAISLATTFICIGFGLHQDGHLCSGRRRHSSHRNNKGAPKGAESEPTLPISDRRPRSRCSSISSHSGKYIPDYGLESSTDSDDDDDPRTKKPRADWMDEALKDVVRSPLLDMPKRRQ